MRRVPAFCMPCSNAAEPKLVWVAGVGIAPCRPGYPFRATGEGPALTGPAAGVETARERRAALAPVTGEAAVAGKTKTSRTT